MADGQGVVVMARVAAGLTNAAERLAAALGPGPLFGGSAGDGTRFRATFVRHGGQALRNAAVLTLLRRDCRARVFNLDHLRCRLRLWCDSAGRFPC